MYTMLQWSTDKNEELIVLIHGKRYTRVEVTLLKGELTHLLNSVPAVSQARNDSALAKKE